jgi:hypothetical protein
MIKANGRFYNNAHRLSFKLASTVTGDVKDGQWLSLNSSGEAAKGINQICGDLLDEPGEAMFSVAWVSVDNFIYAEQYLKTGGIGDDQKRYEAAMAIDTKLKEMFLLMLYDKAPWQIGSEK